MTEETKEHTIEEIEQKMKAARKAYVDYTCMLGDRSLKGVMPDKEEMKEQKFLKSQYDAFNKIFRDMLKVLPSGMGAMGSIISHYKNIESGIAKIQQKIV